MCAEMAAPFRGAAQLLAERNLPRSMVVENLLKIIAAWAGLAHRMSAP